MNRTGRFVFPVLVTVVFSLLLTGCFSASIKPSNMVGMAEVVGPGEIKVLPTGTPQGTGGGTYVVPDGKVLVITRAIIQPMNPGAGTVDITLMQSGGGLPDRIRQTWRTSRSQPTEYDFTPGMLVSTGSTLKVRNNSPSGGGVAVLIYGYVAAPD